MEALNVSSQQLDSLQRIGSTPNFNLAALPAPLKLQSLFVLEEVSRSIRSGEFSGGSDQVQPGQLDTAAGARAGQQTQRQHPLTSLLVGAHGAGSGVAYAVSSKGREIKVHLGQFSGDAAGPDMPAPGSVILRLLRAQFAPIKATREKEQGLGQFSRAGLVLGLPSAVDASRQETIGRPIDQIVRAMMGQSWAVLILAEPTPESLINELRGVALDEIRRAEAMTSASGVSNPLAQRYLDLLNSQLNDLMLGYSIGLWRTATFLLGTPSSFAPLAALWRGLHSQGGISREPLRVIESSQVVEWAEKWIVPNEKTDHPLHPFAHQSLLTSTQLAQTVDMPSREATGFGIRRQARFDVAQARRNDEEDSISIGSIESGGIGQADYMLRTSSLQRHAFVAGMTGSGKTNTVFNLLQQLHLRGVPFLVLEPAKSEYRALTAASGLGEALRIYTAGDERTSPLRINPFEVVGWPTNSVSVHIDLLRSCFTASFGMWTPLPQILEQCLHEIYRDRGWDSVTNKNNRLPDGADPGGSYPTMADLAEKVDVYTSTLGYDDRVRSDLRAALLTRIKGLRVGAKGTMFDCRSSLPMESLLSGPCILELQNLGDDDDKAFLMALLFVRLVEFRRAAGPKLKLSHVLLIEEAHRLLTNVARSGEPEQADPRGKAVETFSNLISEIRAYGQGVAVVDQVPTKLAPDVIKNTNVKIAHRIVAEEDRAVLAGSMAMSDEQKAALASFGVGKVAVFEDGEDAPILVVVPPAKDQFGAPPSDEAVLARMRPDTNGKGGLDWGCPYPSCSELCKASQSDCRTAAEASEDRLIRRTFAKIVVSTMGDAAAKERLWSDLTFFARMRRQISAESSGAWHCLLMHCSFALAHRWGARLGWKYPDVEAFGIALARAVSEPLGADRHDSRGTVSRFVEQGRALFASETTECIACSLCKEKFDDRDPCLARAAAHDLIDDGIFSDVFRAADQEDGREGGSRKTHTLAVGRNAAYELVEFPTSGLDGRIGQVIRARRALLCFAYHMFAKTNVRAPLIIEKQMAGVIDAFEEVRHPEPENGHQPESKAQDAK